MYQGPIELILEDGVLRDVRTRARMGGAPPGSVANDDPAVTGPGWGEIVEGLSVRIERAEPDGVFAQPGPAVFRLTLRNTGAETLYAAPSPELGELEVDGVRYSWKESYYVRREPLRPGRSFVNIAVMSGDNWRSEQGECRRMGVSIQSGIPPWRGEVIPELGQPSGR